MQRLYESEYSCSDILVCTALGCSGSGAIVLFLHAWLGLNRDFELAAILGIELGATVFALLMILFFVSMVLSGVSRVFVKRV